MTLEMGKPLREARLEAARAATIFRFFAGEAWRPKGELFEQGATGAPVYTVRRPLGVVALITPWNFPAAIPAWKLGPALVYGNTVVLKVAQEAPLTGLHLAEAFDRAQIPPGVLNVVIGRGSDVGTPLVRHPDIRAVSFTGSVAVGRQVRDEATALGKRVQLELGGQNPLIVMADADLGRAVEAAYAGAFWSAGQKCTATRRIYVQAPVYDEFRQRLLDRVDGGHVGDPSDPQTEVGPLVNEKQLEDVLAAIERGKAEGGTVLTGGERVDDGAYLLAPTIFEGVADDAMLSCEEVFGPVASLYAFDTLDEALRRANAVEFGLSASIFTTSLESTQRFVNELQAGILHVNSQSAGADVHVPFGGVKGSGFGPHEQGRAALEFYTETVTVYQDV
jgi:aldehyde dehydrogenase (NAD+)